jgi:hypothetical protein
MCVRVEWRGVPRPAWQRSPRLAARFLSRPTVRAWVPGCSFALGLAVVIPLLSSGTLHPTVLSREEAVAICSRSKLPLSPPAESLLTF